MQADILQSTQPVIVIKVYLNDHVTPATSKTVAITISVNKATFANPSGGATNATEIGNGWYYFTPSTTDTGTIGPLIVLGTCSGCDNADQAYHVTKATNRGMTAIPDAVAAASGGLPILGTNPFAISFTAGMTISNNSGDALALSGGTGSGSGLHITSGSTLHANPALLVVGASGSEADAADFIGAANGGDGIYIQGGSNGGNGIFAEAGAGADSAAGACFSGNSGTNYGLQIIGAGNPGLYCVGGTNSPGADFVGGSTGPGILAQGAGTNTYGFQGIGTGSGAGFDSSPNAIGWGVLGLAGLLGTPRALDAIADGSMTLNDALWAAVVAGAGKKDASNPPSYVISTPFTGTVIRTYTMTMISPLTTVPDKIV